MTSDTAMPHRTHAVILASGTGSRIGGKLPKQFLEIGGRSLLEHSVAAFDSHPSIDAVWVVIPAAQRDRALALLTRSRFRKIAGVIDGGATRAASSRNGLAGLDPHDRVLIHDAVRPCVTSDIIDRCLVALEACPAVSVAIPSPDTVIRVDGSVIRAIPERDSMMLAQTPQGFHVDIIQHAHELFARDAGTPVGATFGAPAGAPVRAPVTDDCGLILRYDIAPIQVVEGDPRNVKVTYPEDLVRADELLRPPDADGGS